MSANPTDAKEVALYFIRYTKQEMTQSLISRTIIQAKQLLNRYNSKEIKDVIKYVVEDKMIGMYSLAYLNNTMDKFLHELQASPNQEVIEIDYASIRKEVVTDNEQSAQRNKAKLHRIGNKSRFGEKHNFDLLKE